MDKNSLLNSHRKQSPEDYDILELSTSDPFADDYNRRIDIERSKKEGYLLSNMFSTGIESRLGFYEVLPYIEDKDIDIYDPDLDVVNFKY